MILSLCCQQNTKEFDIGQSEKLRNFSKNRNYYLLLTGATRRCSGYFVDLWGFLLILKNKWSNVDFGR